MSCGLLLFGSLFLDGESQWVSKTGGWTLKGEKKFTFAREDAEPAS
jgi:hypothetical protein